MNKFAIEYSPDEMLVCAIAREIRSGDLVVQGIATPLVLSAFLLAKRRHAPDLQFLYTSGCSVSQKFGPVRLAGIEALTIQGCLGTLSSPQFHAEFAAALKAKEFLRPAQVDGAGCTNNVAIGSYLHPKVRLPGCGGIADVTTFNSNLYLYVPRHDRRSLVKQLDFVSGVGDHIQALYTNLCTFQFAGGQAVLHSLRRGVSLDEVRAQTGFPFGAPLTVPCSPAPDPEELRLLREEIDPLGLRRLEFSGGRDRLALLRQLVTAEKAAFNTR